MEGKVGAILLALVLDLLRGIVHLLLSLFGTTTKPQDEMKGGLLNRS